MKILVSIVISTRNGSKYIKKAIESVERQSYKNIEIIIVDDDSIDETFEIISGFKEKDPRIIILRNETNIGSYKSLNKAIRISKGKYIANIDDDDFWCDQRKIEKQVEFLERYEDYGLVGGGMVKIDIKSNQVGKYLFPENDKDIRKSLLLHNLFAHSAVLFRKSIWEKVGGYNALFAYAADMDLWLRIGRVSKMHNFQEYFVYCLDKEADGDHSSRNLGYRRNVRLNVAMLRQYKNNYPGYIKAVFLCWAGYFYSFVPYKKMLRPALIKMRRLIFGSFSYERFEQKHKKR
jgi:glycosyltransferase involved in cell wall biosynthesis